jgi:hypothetical protein
MSFHLPNLRQPHFLCNIFSQFSPAETAQQNWFEQVFLLKKLSYESPHLWTETACEMLCVAPVICVSSQIKSWKLLSQSLSSFITALWRAQSLTYESLSESEAIKLFSYPLASSCLSDRIVDHFLLAMSYLWLRNCMSFYSWHIAFATLEAFKQK